MLGISEDGKQVRPATVLLCLGATLLGRSNCRLQDLRQRGIRVMNSVVVAVRRYLMSERGLKLCPTCERVTYILLWSSVVLCLEGTLLRVFFLKPERFSARLIWNRHHQVRVLVHWLSWRIFTFFARHKRTAEAQFFVSFRFVLIGATRTN